MKNIHVLSTDKPSRFYSVAGSYTKSSGFAFGEHYIPDTRNTFKNCNIYITTADEEIKDGEWMYVEGVDAMAYGIARRSRHMQPEHFGNCKKIVLTTDPELIKDGVQSIDDNFLEWFIKNPKSENVYVYKEYKQVNQNNPVTRGSTALAFSHYEVQSLDLSSPIGTNEKEIMANLPNGDDFFKQETLEEAATNYLHRVADGKRFTGYADEDFINGAKWQADKVFNDDVIQTLEKALAILLKRQERMYNENEVELIANEMVNWAIDNVGNPNPQSGRKFDEVIAKFKKK